MHHILIVNIMRITKLTATLLLCSALMACGNTNDKSSQQSKGSNAEKSNTEKSNAGKSEVVTPKRYSYRIVAEYPHATTSYTQGLEYVDGVMWEGTGQKGESQLHTVELTSGKVTPIHRLNSDHFGEGITHLNGRIYQLTWMDNIAYVYDTKGNFIKHIPYVGEGWGITTDGEKLYMSDGTSNIHIVDPETLERKGVIGVKYAGHALRNINELEWIDGKIWANIYLDNTVVVIDPATGAVEAYVDLRELKGTQYNNPNADVLNGIAYNPATGHIYVTGKYWNRLFELKITK